MGSGGSDYKANSGQLQMHSPAFTELGNNEYMMFTKSYSYLWLSWSSDVISEQH